MQPKNPFILGHRIERPYFCDRFDEEKALTSAVINGRNVVLISPRRMGKTSLIYVAVHNSPELSQEYTTLFVDILQTNSIREFTYLLGKTVFDKLLSKNESKIREFVASLKSLKGSFGFDHVSGLPSFDIQLGDIKTPEYTIEEIFNYLENNDKPVIVVIDEFQQVTKYPEKNTEAILRSHLQNLTNATFLFAGSEQTILQEMFVSSKRPFYNSAQLMYLKPIDEDLYIEFAQSLFEQREKHIDEEAIKWAFELFDGNTFYVQRTMNGVFADTSKGSGADIRKTLHAVREMMASNEVMYREMLSNVSVSQKSLLVAIAREKEAQNVMSGAFIRKHALVSASSVQSAVNKLIKSGMVYKSDDCYKITDPLLRIFINELYSWSELILP